MALAALLWNLIQDPKIDSTNYIHINNKNARKAVLEMKDNVALRE